MPPPVALTSSSSLVRRSTPGPASRTFPHSTLTFDASISRSGSGICEGEVVATESLVVGNGGALPRPRFVALDEHEQAVRDKRLARYARCLDRFLNRGTRTFDLEQRVHARESLEADHGLAESKHLHIAVDGARADVAKGVEDAGHLGVVGDGDAQFLTVLVTRLE